MAYSDNNDSTASTTTATFSAAGAYTFQVTSASNATGVGLFGNADLQKSLGINMNLWWGLVLVVFGVFMLLMAWRGSARKP